MTSITRPTSDLLRSAVNGKIALVTGAASGIGLAIAKQWVEHGAIVILADVNKQGLEAARQQLGPNSVAYVCDVASWSEQVKLFNYIRLNYGAPDIVCLNAGIDPEIMKLKNLPTEQRKKLVKKVLYDYLADEYEKEDASSLEQPADIVFEVNLKGVMYGIKLAVHHMRNGKKPGHIIAVGSAASYTSFPAQEIYVAAKHGVLGLVRVTSTHRHLQNNDIGLSMVAPWATDTPLSKDLMFENALELVSSAEDVAWAASYLTTISPDMANGKSLWIQGTEITEVEDSYAEWLTRLIKLAMHSKL